MNNRPIHELLMVLLDNIERIDYTLQGGLCSLTEYCYGFDLLTFKEKFELREYIEDNRPSKFSSFHSLFQAIIRSDFFWKQYNKPHRIKWLKKHIQKTKPIGTITKYDKVNL